MKKEIMPKVSIIIPMYNVEEYIRKCIESCINQTEKNIEIIIINDESPDNCHKIAKEYEKIDNRIKVINQKNSGVSVARNKGIEYATGEWIMFVDGDDWLEKDCIKTMLKYAKDNKYDVIISGFYDFDGINSEKKHFFKSNIKEFKKNNIDIVKSCISKTNITGNDLSTNVGVPWAKLYNKDFLNNNNCRFEIGLKRMQDMIFNIETLYLAKKILSINECTYNYRKNITSATHKFTKDFSNTSEKILKSLSNFMKKYNLENELNDYYNIKKFKLFIETIKLQYIPEQQKLTAKEKIKEIKKISKEFELKTIKLFDLRKLISKKDMLLICLIKVHFYKTLYNLLEKNYKRKQEKENE